MGAGNTRGYRGPPRGDVVGRELLGQSLLDIVRAHIDPESEETMKPFPHHYAAEATARPSGNVSLVAEGVPPIGSAPPVEFDGPGDSWSPESLLVAALADCFVLTFRAVARASHFEWNNLECRAEGKLDRLQGISRFVSFRVSAHLTIPAGADEATGRALLAKSERACLVTNSLVAPVELLVEIAVG
jgi:organic hydroperoxide reductase OsmC/OhrA